MKTKKENPKKKLSLSKEKITVLNDLHLRGLIGGVRRQTNLDFS